MIADSAVTGKPLVVITGRRPLSGGLTPGAEEALFTMKAGMALVLCFCCKDLVRMLSGCRCGACSCFGG